ncbi:hypothetical protein BDU57DRAFT_522298 [Ampelomyces quisqualis]|uniref:Uncharacterized protein n=1 Tax=Ampelomyces quisqualis TaxID=50730 RepID=A0A6A5QDJ0_AMPQU|nr:hypothetical protein BDU57DRAFT_522298 [Ampelomyces quisqualis]
MFRVRLNGAQRKRLMELPGTGNEDKWCIGDDGPASVPCEMRCDAQLQLANQRSATTTLPSSSLLGHRTGRDCKMTPSGCIRSSLTRARGKENRMQNSCVLCSVLGAASIGVAVKYHASHWTGCHTTCINNSAVGPYQGPFHSILTASSMESSRQDTTVSPLIGADPRVAATIQICGERHTISPPHFDMLLLSPWKARASTVQSSSSSPPLKCN